MKTPLFLTLSLLSLPLTVQARDLFVAPVHLGNGSTKNNGQPVHGAVPKTYSTSVQKPKVTTVPYDAEQMSDTSNTPTTVTTKQGTTITTESYAPTPPAPTTPTINDTPAVPLIPVINTPTQPTATTEPAPTVTPTQQPVTATSNEAIPVASVAVERAAPPPAVQLPAGQTQAAEPIKTAADNNGYADKMFDAIKSMLGQKTQPIDDSLIRDEK